ncbi:MAG: phosphoribosylformylglycinamidine synthase I [Candidatus Aenigmatarchaeota archaeon]
MMVKTLVLRADGTNCDEETAYAFHLAGSHADSIHINELMKGKKSLDDYQILAIPGGFAHGDDVASGKILANLIRFRLSRDFVKFIESGKLVIGICNGFQAIVKAGLLPAFAGFGNQEATLAANDSGYFIDKWVTLNHVNKGKCVFTKGMKSEIFVPINHGEGKFIASPEILHSLETNDQVVFTYKDNPNGSMNSIAGICNTQGNVFGLMPHPEKFVSKYTHPSWTRDKWLPEEGDGLAIFRNAVNYAKKKF